MPLSAGIRQQCRAFLSPDARIDYLFPATLLSSGVAIFGLAPVIVAVTDTEIVVLSTAQLRRDKPTSVYQRYPRDTRFGPLDLRLAPKFELGMLQLEIDEEYAAVVLAADAELDVADALPPDPLPDM